MTYPHVQYLGPAHPDPSQQVETTTRELDSRAGDGMRVRLLWHPSDGHVSVAVRDAKDRPHGTEPIWRPLAHSR